MTAVARSFTAAQPNSAPCAMDRLENLSTALNALRDLLIPSDGTHAIDRGELASLLYLVKVQWIEDHPGNTDIAEMADSASYAICDLLTPSCDLYTVSRDRLCAMVDLIARLHGEAMSDLQRAISPCESRMSPLAAGA